MMRLFRCSRFFTAGRGIERAAADREPNRRFRAARQASSISPVMPFGMT
jgi:hypothetical protein